MDLLGFLDKNLAVISAIVASLITSLFTFLMQRSNNKSKLKEMSHQMTLKIKEQEYHEKRKIILKILKLLEVLNQPSNFSFDTTEETGTNYMLKSRKIITKNLSDFHIEFSPFINTEVADAVSELSQSLTNLEEAEFEFHSAGNDSSMNMYDIALAAHCYEAAFAIFPIIEKFKKILRKQLILQ